MILDLIGGIRGVLAALAGAALMFGAMSIADLADDRAVAKAARETQLAQFEADSAKALANALLVAGRAQAEAIEAAQRDRLESDRLQTQISERMEGEIAKLKTTLADSGRSCPLDQSDVDWLRNAGRKAVGSGK